jgi:hypothetical protein
MFLCIYAQVAELVYALVLGTSGAILGGSSPLLGTKAKKRAILIALFFNSCFCSPGEDLNSGAISSSKKISELVTRQNFLAKKF